LAHRRGFSFGVGILDSEGMRMSETHSLITGDGIVCYCHSCTQARRTSLEKALDVPTEMASLKEIKAKLNALHDELEMHRDGMLGAVTLWGERFCRAETRLETIAESQGKLLAALNELSQREIDRAKYEQFSSSFVSRELQALDKKIGALSQIVNTSNEETCNRLDAIEAAIQKVSSTASSASRRAQNRPRKK
jgi:hypothetical protein